MVKHDSRYKYFIFEEKRGKVVRYITKKNGYLEKIIIDRDKNIKKQIYELMRRDDYSLTLGNLYRFFGIEEEEEDGNRAIYLRRVYFQYIKEEMA